MFMQIEDAIIISPAFFVCLYYDYMCSKTDFKKKVIFIHLQESPIRLYCMYVCAGYMFMQIEDAIITSPACFPCIHPRCKREITHQNLGR